MSEELPPYFGRFSPEGRKVLELSLRRALAKGHNYIGLDAIGAAVEEMGRRAKCPCKEPAPARSGPCTPDKPCPYAQGRIEDLWL